MKFMAMFLVWLGQALMPCDHSVKLPHDWKWKTGNNAYATIGEITSWHCMMCGKVFEVKK